MTSQVIFKVDKKIKTQAMKKAQEQGIPFASILKLATVAYVEGRLDVDVVEPRRLNKKTTASLRHVLKDLKQGKNLSPVFHTAQEAIKYLRKA